MLEFRPVLFVVGVLLTTLSVGMWVPLVIDGMTGNPDWRVFAGASGLTLFVGGTTVFTGQGARSDLTLRQAFVLTTLSWLVLTTFAALPFVFADLGLSYTDAFFEAMSGITTTGSTVIAGLDHVPRGILIWRAILQWLGGIGIIVMAVAILPMLQIGGMQLFRMESSDRSDKAMPRIAQVAASIVLIYVALTVMCALALSIAGMDGFDAIAHGMATLATGGFSTYDDSIGHFDSIAIELVITVFMLTASLPLVLYLRALQGSPGMLLRDTQVRWFLSAIALFVVTISLWEHFNNHVPFFRALRLSSFNVVAVVTTTGYATADYATWGGFAVTAFAFLIFVGGCTGSTAGGIKIFRFEVLSLTMSVQFQRLIHPHGIFVAHFNQRPITEEISGSVMGFFFLFIATFAVVAMALGAVGLDPITALSGAATALCNVGPGLGERIGPSQNFSTLPDAAKWILSLGMLLGRLELFTVLVLFWPSFWRS